MSIIKCHISGVR